MCCFVLFTSIGNANERILSLSPQCLSFTTCFLFGFFSLLYSFSFLLHESYLMLFFTRMQRMCVSIFIYLTMLLLGLSWFFFRDSSSSFFSFSRRFFCGKYKLLVIVIVVFLFLLRHIPRTGEKAKNSRLFYRDGNELSFSLSLRSFFIIVFTTTSTNNSKTL